MRLYNSINESNMIKIKIIKSINQFISTSLCEVDTYSSSAFDAVGAIVLLNGKLYYFIHSYMVWK